MIYTLFLVAVVFVLKVYLAMSDTVYLEFGDLSILSRLVVIGSGKYALRQQIFLCPFHTLAYDHC